MSKRKVKQFAIENDMFSSNYGTMNRIDPTVIFIEAKCWVKPIEEMNYVKTIDNISSSLKQFIRCHINKTSFDNQFIFESTINSIALSLNKSKSYSFEIFIKQKNEIENIYNIDIKSFMKPIFEFAENIFIDNGFEIRKCK